MKEVKLRMNEYQKYKKIKYLVEHNGNKKRTAVELGISTRQINRLINIYKERGKSGFVHGNRNKKPANSIDKSLSDEIILLYTNKYQGFNFNHFKEYLEEDENIKISYSYIYKTLTSNNILSPRARKITKKEFVIKQKKLEKQMQDKTDDEIEMIVNREVALEDSHPRQERPKYFGENIEMDGSIHLWFGDSKVCLHLAIDKATGNVVGGFFDKQETLFGYYNVFKQILENYGIPYKFTTDNRTVFFYQLLNKSKKNAEKDVLTQFGYACKSLGVDLKTTSVAQGKPLIERTNGTFQGRLINELRLNGINTIDKANIYLINVFIPKFNKRFGFDINKFESVFETSPDKNKINYTLAILSTRKFDNGNSIKYKNKYYQPYQDNKLICFRPKTECLVIKTFDNSLLVTVDNKIYELRELKKHKEFSPEFDEVIEKVEPKKYIPPMSHPWKAESFKKQIQKAHTKHIYA